MNKRERFARELETSRELHKIDVAFIRAGNPVFTPEVGARKAIEFIANLTVIAEHMEGDETKTIRHDGPAHYEVEAFFTDAQRAEVKALHDRGELVEMKFKASEYDKLDKLLWDIGLCPDQLLTEGKGAEDAIVIHDLELAKEWWRAAYVLKPPFDDED